VLRPLGLLLCIKYILFGLTAASTMETANVAVSLSLIVLTLQVYFGRTNGHYVICNSVNISCGQGKLDSILRTCSGKSFSPSQRFIVLRSRIQRSTL